MKVRIYQIGVRLFSDLHNWQWSDIVSSSLLHSWAKSFYTWPSVYSTVKTNMSPVCALPAWLLWIALWRVWPGRWGRWKLRMASALPAMPSTCWPATWCLPEGVWDTRSSRCSSRWGRFGVSGPLANWRPRTPGTGTSWVSWFDPRSHKPCARNGNLSFWVFYEIFLQESSLSVHLYWRVRFHEFSPFYQPQNK